MTKMITLEDNLKNEAESKNKDNLKSKDSIKTNNLTWAKVCYGATYVGISQYLILEMT